MQNEIESQNSEMKPNQKPLPVAAQSNTIRAVAPDDAAALMTMIEEVGMFPSHELAEVGEMLNGYLDGSLGED